MAVKKINVAVIMGGKSTEHDISLKTGTTIINSLDITKYNIKPILINKKGNWQITKGYLKEIPSQNYTKKLLYSENSVLYLNPSVAIDYAKEEKVDVVFNALHGKYGEDGSIQGLFEIFGIPYTGSGVLASSLSMNKVKSSEVYQFHGLVVPNYLYYSKNEFYQNTKKTVDCIVKTIHLPCILKPVDGGSSVATFKIKSKKEIISKVREVFKVSTQALFQQFISGDEVTCAILDSDDEPFALPPTQIIPKEGEFFDKKSKYKMGGSEEITPPRLAEEIVLKIQEIALKCHRILGCSGLSRTDLIIGNGKFYVLETNTLPGMTQTSLFPQAAASTGLKFPDLLSKIISNALKRKNV